MAWGLPPKFEFVKELNNPNTKKINTAIVSILKEHNFEIISVHEYSVQAKKKMPFSVLNIISCARPYMNISVLISKKGRLTFQSTYIYNSRTGGTMTDSGKQKKIILSMVEGLTTQLRN